MSPVAQADGHDMPGLAGEPIPGITAVIDDVLEGGEDPVREPVVASELPDVLHRVQLGRLGREWYEGEVGRDHQPFREMPTGLIKEHGSVSTRRDRLRDFGQ